LDIGSGGDAMKENVDNRINHLFKLDFSQLLPKHQFLAVKEAEKDSIINMCEEKDVSLTQDSLFLIFGEINGNVSDQSVQ
jgi:hypothetical protein